MNPHTSRILALCEFDEKSILPIITQLLEIIEAQSETLKYIGNQEATTLTCQMRMKCRAQEALAEAKALMEGLGK
jgi:hypothetical protein